MYNKIVFYNHFHSGDLHVSRNFVKWIINNVDSKEYVYRHNTSKRNLLDIKKLNQIDTLTESEKNGIYLHDKNDLYINTWYASLESKYFKEKKCTLKTLYNYFYNELKHFNIILDDNIDLYIPSIDFNVYDISKIDKFMNENKDKYKIFIGNANSLSNQSDNNIIIDNIVNKLSRYFKDILFITSNKIEYPNEDNVICIKDLLTMKLDNDLNECAYASTFCDIIIGRFSGPQTFAYNIDNLYRNKKFICLVMENYNNQINFSLENHGTEFIPCNYTDENIIFNFIREIIEKL